MDRETGLSGRRAEALRNDRRILESAREVFVRDPGAPISAVAEHARVGISALYRRYASKEELLRSVCADGLRRYTSAVERALGEADIGEAFPRFMHDIVEEDTHSLTLRLAGTFTPTEELGRAAERAHELTVELFARAQRAGAVRADVVVDDLAFLFEQLASVRAVGVDRTRQLRQRYLALILDALAVRGGRRLPGPPPGWIEVQALWTP